MKVTGAYRINYAIMGNSDPYLHAHIVPRYSDEPEEYLHDQPWSYPERSGVEGVDWMRSKVAIEDGTYAIKLRKSGAVREPPLPILFYSFTWVNTLNLGGFSSVCFTLHCSAERTSAW